MRSIQPYNFQPKGHSPRLFQHFGFSLTGWITMSMTGAGREPTRRIFRRLNFEPRRLESRSYFFQGQGE
eukprot:5618261-Prymnesium_polylepis.1